MTPSLRVSDYANQLRDIALRFHIPVDIEIVPDIFKWCIERKIPEDHPFRIAKALKNIENDRYLILITEYLTPEKISPILTGIEQSSYFSEDQIRKITDLKIFLLHLLLHEISHVLDGTLSEEQCDQWAFNQIEINQLSLD